MASKTSVLLAVAREEKLTWYRKRNEKTRKGKQKKIQNKEDAVK